MIRCSSAGPSRNLSRSLREVQFRAIEHMILATTAGNLDGADAVAQFGTAPERPAAFQTIEECAAEGITAAGRVEHLVRRDTRYVAARGFICVVPMADPSTTLAVGVPI